jgi:hypothetical protein
MTQTTKKIMTKSQFAKMQEKKYAEPTERAKTIIDRAEPDDRLKLKFDIEGKPKVLEASRLQSMDDIVIAFNAEEPFDSEQLGEDNKIEEDPNKYFEDSILKSWAEEERQKADDLTSGLFSSGEDMKLMGVEFIFVAEDGGFEERTKIHHEDYNPDSYY